MMKKNIALYLVGILSLGCALAAQAQQATGATEKAIAALEEQWTQADKANSADMLAPLLAEQYVGTNPDGKVSDRKQALADEKASKTSSEEIEDLQVTGIGTTAIARYVYKGKGTNAAGKPFETQARYTDTWVKMPNGKWQCVASHGSNVKM